MAVADRTVPSPSLRRCLCFGQSGFLEVEALDHLDRLGVELVTKMVLLAEVAYRLQLWLQVDVAEQRAVAGDEGQTSVAVLLHDSYRVYHQVLHGQF